MPATTVSGNLNGASGLIQAKNGVPQATPLGSGHIYRFPSPNLFESSGGTGSYQGCEPIMVSPFNNTSPVNSSDASFGTADLTGYVPSNVMAVELLLGVYSASLGTPAQPYLFVRKVGSVADNPGAVPSGGGILFNKGAALLAGQSAIAVYTFMTVWVSLSPDFKFQYQRVVNGGSHYFYCQVIGWQLRSGCAKSAPQIVVPAQSGAYPSFPYSWRDDQGNTHVGYCDSSNYISNPGSHTANKDLWYIKNGGTPTNIADYTALGCTNISDALPLQFPNSSTIHMYARQDDETHFAYMHMTSADYGDTWSAPAAIPWPTAFSNGDPYVFFDFIVSSDGQSLLALAYGLEPGQTGTHYSLGLFQTTAANPTIWTLKSWINRYSVTGLGITEAGFIRFSSGRLVVAARPPVAHDPGYTFVSDDEVTWTAPQVQGSNAIWEAPRGYAASTVQGIVYGRWNAGGSGNPSASTAWWTIDTNGMVTSGPSHFTRLAVASNGGYPTLVRTNAGYQMWNYTDLGVNNGPNLVVSNFNVMVP